jgi:glycosyltransferase involved in cell wall biosynthesis
MNISNQKRVSVITIFFNEERFIRESIESVLAQTYQNWELLLVDDGSRDESTIIAQEYAQKYPDKIFYLQHEEHQNKGMSATRNLGIEKAQGEYIAFLDADDVWLPQKLSEQVAILNLYPEASLVCGRSQWWYSWTGEETDQQRDFLQKFNVPLDTLVQPPAVFLMFLQDDWASLHDILIRGQIIEKVGGYENAFTGMYEDQVFHTKLCLNFPVFVSSQFWHRYRQHSQSCCSVSHHNQQYQMVRLSFLDWLKSYLAQSRNQNQQIWKIVEKQELALRHPLLFRLSEFSQHPLQSIQTWVEKNLAKSST